MLLGLPYRPKIGSDPINYPNGWPYRQSAIVPVARLGLAVSISPLILLLRRTHPDLRSVANNGRVQSSLGWDLRYQLPGGGKLVHDLVHYDPVGGTASAFVRMPGLDVNQQLQIDLYFGRVVAATEADPGACWLGLNAIDLSTGVDRAGGGADLILDGVLATMLAGMPAGDYTLTGGAGGAPELALFPPAIASGSSIYQPVLGISGGGVTLAPPLIATVAALYPPTVILGTSPFIGTVTKLELDTTADQAVFTFATHNSATGNLAVFLATRSMSTPSPLLQQVTWNGVALDSGQSTKLDGTGRASAWCGLLQGGATGTRSLVVTFDQATTRDFCGWVVDLHGVGASALGVAIGITTNVMQGSQSVTITPTHGVNLLLAAAFAMDGGSSPFTVSADWTEVSEAQSGIGTNNVVGVLARRIAGGTSALTFTATGALATDDWSALAMEIQPSTGPEIGTIGKIQLNTTVPTASLTISHTTATGNMAIFVCTRSNQTTTPAVSSATWGGAAVTMAYSALLNGSGRASAWCGVIRGGAIGTNNFVCNFSPTDNRDFCGFMVDLDQIGTAPIGAANGIVTNVLKNSETISLTPTNANSLLLGAVFALDGSIDPFTVSAGWTELSEAQAGSGTADPVAVLAGRPAGGTSPVTFTATGAASTDDWAALIVEILPAGAPAQPPAPPAGWESFTALNVTAGGVFDLLNDTSYKIVAQTAATAVRLRGGRKVVIMGLTVNVNNTPDWLTVGEAPTCGLELQENPYAPGDPLQGGLPQADRAFHVEGLLTQGNTLTQGIRTKCHTADVTIVKWHCTKVLFDSCDHRDGTNGVAIVHPDTVQTYGSQKSLTIWGATLYSAYQGLFFKQDQNPQNGPISLSHLDIHGASHLGSDGITYYGQRMLWNYDNQALTLDGDTVWVQGHVKNGWQNGTNYFRERYWDAGGGPSYVPNASGYAESFNSGLNGWAGGSGTVVSAESTEKHSGAGSLKMTGVVFPPTGQGTLRCFEPINDRDMTPFGLTIGVWLKVAAGTAGTWEARLGYYDSTDGIYKEPYGSFVIAVGSWVLATQTFTAAELDGVRRVAVRVYGNNVNATPIVYVDDVTQGSMISGSYVLEPAPSDGTDSDALMPQPTATGSDGLGAYATWAANIVGRCRLGSPPGGEYVPAASVGAGYVR